METFRKSASLLGIATEVASLRWLAAASGAPVAELVAVGERWLTTRKLAHGRATASSAFEFGVGLARTHAAGASHFGAAPPGLTGDGDLAGVPLPMTERADLTWGEFYATMRIEPYVRIATDRGQLDRRDRDIIVRCCEWLCSGEVPDAPPTGSARVARLHGDLWGGNVLWTAPDGQGVLIDPAAHGGHAETDLASLALFGSPHLAATIDGYESVHPLAAGWPDRVGLHQLYLLAVHAALFGGGYGAQTARAAAPYAA